ncbi:MAG: amidohydrolase [Deltaproteobacteria bacterium]|nr:MAG: amidohydrolase [Deltaproteobacteria bacterium]
MAMPEDIPIIDLLMGNPGPDAIPGYGFLAPLIRDPESLGRFDFPVEYIFKDAPKQGGRPDTLRYVLEEMDKYGVERGMIALYPDQPGSLEATKQHPDRFIASCEVDPNQGVDAVRHIQRMHDEFGIRSVTVFPAGCVPQVPINDKRMYPIYTKCVELDLPICVCVGVPGPRIPMLCQHVELIDEVCWFFPELKFVMRHGAEPWTDLAVKLMLKWPNLYYSTSAFAPKHYPSAIIDYANTRGADKILFAGYFPLGLSYERIFRDLHGVPFNDNVWPRFLRENALRVFGFDG